MLAFYTGNKTDHYYICGPEKFTEAMMVAHLKKQGVDEARIVIEQ